MKQAEKTVSSHGENVLGIEAFGVKIGIKVYSPDCEQAVRDRLRQALPTGFKSIDYEMGEHFLEIRRTPKGRLVLHKNGERLGFARRSDVVLEYFESQIRLTVAEYAESRVFVHAGVVGWKGRAIIIPARSFQGKTTLVAELSRLGAKYYSDEYAVLDENGLVHPFPKTLSVRGVIDRYKQVEIPVEEFGGEAGKEPIPVGMVVLTEYKAGAKWRPKKLSGGMGVLEMLSHTIPIRYRPEFSIKVLNKIMNRAIIVKTKRGEAREFAVQLLRFFDSSVQ